MEPLVVGESWHDGVLLLRPVGDLDVYTAPLLRDRLVSAMTDSPGGRVRLVVDLARVPFVDSAGLGVLIAGFKAARAAGGDLALSGVPPVTARLLQLMGVHRVVPIHPDAQAALEDAGARHDSDQPDRRPASAPPSRTL